MGMTLAQWNSIASVPTRLHATGAQWVPDVIANIAIRADLWHLSDYVVTSVTGGSIWLVARCNKGGR